MPGHFLVLNGQGFVLKDEFCASLRHPLVLDGQLLVFQNEFGSFACHRMVLNGKLFIRCNQFCQLVFGNLCHHNAPKSQFTDNVWQIQRAFSEYH